MGMKRCWLTLTVPVAEQRLKVASEGEGWGDRGILTPTILTVIKKPCYQIVFSMLKGVTAKAQKSRMHLQRRRLPTPRAWKTGQPHTQDGCPRRSFPLRCDS